MPPAWRLAINTLFDRPGRTLLLAAAVALSSALIVVVSCALTTAHMAIEKQIGATVGRADLKIQSTGGGGTIPAALLDLSRQWPEVLHAEASLSAALPLEIRRDLHRQQADGSIRVENLPLTTFALATGLSPGASSPPRVLEGRLPSADDEIAICTRGVEALTWAWHAEMRRVPMLQFRAQDDATQARIREAMEVNRLAPRATIGDELIVRRLLRQAARLRIVGVIEPPPMGDRAMVWLTLDGLQRVQGTPGRFSQIEIVLRPGFDPEEVAEVRRRELGDNVLIQPTAKITAGLDRNVQSSELGFILSLVLSTIAAAFIILTGLNVTVAERQRELAVLRCIGATKGQIARSQLMMGGVLGLIGASIGLPMGLGLAWVIAISLREQLRAELAVSPSGLILASVGALASGLIGAAWPAWRASRVTPMRAMRSRANPPRARDVLILLTVGLGGLLVQMLLMGVPRDGQVVFWSYATVGLPIMFLAYFLLSVPLAAASATVFSPVISRALGLPARMLARTVRATPYAHGLTAGALMGGLALMVSLWTNGTAVLRDWLDKMDFPDAFVSGLALSEDAQRRLEALPFVRDTCAITLHPVETDSFGVRALQTYRSTFIAFEPEAFFRITKLTWAQGDEATARRRLAQGGAIIVAREFLTARGLGVGDALRLRSADAEHEFEIVGVVTSPGLDVVSKFFNIGEEYYQQSVHAVFGTREDLKTRFGSEAIHLIQIDLEDGVDDAQAVQTIREELFDAGILDAGSGRRIKEEIREFARGSMLVFTSVAIVQMIVACFGVANIIIAAIDARQFEFGVLRAVGAPRSLLCRLLVGEAIIIAITACIAGTLLGLQGSWAGQRLHELLLGLVLELRPPWSAIAAGWGILALTTLAATAPGLFRLSRSKPRELLAAMKG